MVKVETPITLHTKREEARKEFNSSFFVALNKLKTKQNTIYLSLNE